MEEPSAEPTQEIAPAQTPDPIADHNAKTTDPDAPAEILEVKELGQHQVIYAGNADSLGSLNAVLNRLTAEGRRVMSVRRVWAVKVMAAETPDQVAAREAEQLIKALDAPEASPEAGT